MVGVFSLLGLGGGGDEGGGAGAGGGDPPPKPRRNSQPNLATTAGLSPNAAAGKRGVGLPLAEAPGAGKEPAIKQCDGCGEMRKTTQGLCAACFLTGGGSALGGGGGGGRRRREEKAAAANGGAAAGWTSEGRLPSLTLANGNGTRPPVARARSPTDKARDVKNLASGTSSSSMSRPRSSSGKGDGLSHMLEMQKAAIKAQREEDAVARLVGNARGFAAAPASQSAPQLRVDKSGNSNVKLNREGSYRPGGSVAVAKAEENEKAKKEAKEGTASGPSKDGSSAAERAAKERAHRRNHTLPAGMAGMPPPDFPGGFRRGDIVQSLVSRIRNGRQVLELGHEGTVVGGNVWLSNLQQVDGGKAAAENNPNARLLVQFKVGYDWQLAPHQVCHQAQFQAHTAAGLPGGFKWGDRVQSLVAKLQPHGAKRGLCLGEEGTVVGPGSLIGKIAIRFSEDCGEWSLWPNAVCKVEAYAAALAARLPGGFRRGDRVKSKALKVISGGDQCGTGDRPSGLEDGQEGTIVGPGHCAGRLLVCFDGNPAGWSVEPTALVPV